MKPAGLLSLLLSQDCFLCAQAAGEDLLCAGCRADLPSLSQAHCPRCAAPSPGAAVCGACLKNPPRFDGTLALWAYRFPIEELVGALKYHARLPLAPWVAAAMARDISAPEVDCVVAMPLHTRRLAVRGFNQSVEIARPLARAWDLPLLLEACMRDRDTPPQAGLDYKSRRGNVKGAFRAPVSLAGKRVLVVDDVMTTGSSLDELAGALKAAGAASVINCVAARTQHEYGGKGYV